MTKRHLSMWNLAEGLGWAVLPQRYWFLLSNFRNGRSLVRSLRSRQPCDVAALRNGACLLHPSGRGGFIETILELWHEEVYTSDGFYQPADRDVIVDVGANVGLFTIWLAKRNPHCRVLALEPFPENFVLLQANLNEARVRSATPYRIALGAIAGQGYMIADGARSLDHRLSAKPDSGQCRPVPTLPLQGAP